MKNRNLCLIDYGVKMANVHLESVPFIIFTLRTMDSSVRPTPYCCQTILYRPSLSWEGRAKQCNSYVDNVVPTRVRRYVFNTLGIGVWLCIWRGGRNIFRPSPCKHTSYPSLKKRLRRPPSKKNNVRAEAPSKVSHVSQSDCLDFWFSMYFVCYWHLYVLLLR